MSSPLYNVHDVYILLDLQRDLSRIKDLRNGGSTFHGTVLRVNQGNGYLCVQFDQPLSASQIQKSKGLTAQLDMQDQGILPFEIRQYNLHPGEDGCSKAFYINPSTKFVKEEVYSRRWRI